MPRFGWQGEGWFTVAGTVYKTEMQTPSANGKIHLYTGPEVTGLLVATVEVDKLGNFFTTESIGMVSGVYPSVVAVSGQEVFISQIITN